MTGRTKLIAALSAVAVLAVASFLLFPALFPDLYPSEELSKGSDAKIQAQDSSSSTSVTSKCTYSDAGNVRTVYSDGAELFKFHGDHRIEVEAPLARSDRSAITTYSDGTVRVEIFEVGTLTRQMPFRKPLETRWFKPDGSSRGAPEAGTYPDLWERVGEFFEYPRPSRETWRNPEWVPPGTDDADLRDFGVTIRRIPHEGDDGYDRYFEDGTWVIVSGDGKSRHYSWRDPFGGKSYWISMSYRDGGIVYIDGRNFDRGVLPVCDPDGEQVRIRYPDGTVRMRVYPPGTQRQQLVGTDYVCESWYNKAGERIDAQPDEQYPLPDLGLPPLPDGR